MSISTGPKPRPVRVCLVDMNNGHENQAMRCFGVIVSQFKRHIATANPGLEVQTIHVQPRNRHEQPPDDCDLYLGSGGPGSPYDHDGEAWTTDFARFIDGIVEENSASGVSARALFAVCYSFELVVRHFGFAEMCPRATRKFGVMPIYPTNSGQDHALLSAFGDRLFAFEHRNWEAIHFDASVLERLGGKLLARESREGRSDKGEAVMAVDAAPGVEAVQFHPEADRPGVVAWVSRPDQAAAFRQAYGDDTYERMLKTLDDPTRLARTFALLIPGWMVRKFNGQAPSRGWNTVGPPVEDMSLFGSGLRAADASGATARSRTAAA